MGWWSDRGSAVVVPVTLLLILLIPDGRLPSARWRPVVIVVMSAQLVVVALWCLVPVLPVGWASAIEALELMLVLPFLLGIAAVFQRLKTAKRPTAGGQRAGRRPGVRPPGHRAGPGVARSRRVVSHRGGRRPLRHHPGRRPPGSLRPGRDRGFARAGLQRADRRRPRCVRRHRGGGVPGQRSRPAGRPAHRRCRARTPSGAATAPARDTPGDVRRHRRTAACAAPAVDLGCRHRRPHRGAGRVGAQRPGVGARAMGDRRVPRPRENQRRGPRTSGRAAGPRRRQWRWRWRHAGGRASVLGGRFATSTARCSRTSPRTVPGPLGSSAWPQT